MTTRDVRDVVLARLPAIGSPGERPFTDPEIDREYVEALQRSQRTSGEKERSKRARHERRGR